MLSKAQDLRVKVQRGYALAEDETEKPGLGYRVWGLVKTTEDSRSNSHLPPALQVPSSRKEC
jgi:hypothetical protein